MPTACITNEPIDCNRDNMYLHQTLPMLLPNIQNIYSVLVVYSVHNGAAYFISRDIYCDSLVPESSSTTSTFILVMSHHQTFIKFFWTLSA